LLLVVATASVSDPLDHQFFATFTKMARGQQKIQAQEKNAKKLQDKKKQAAGSTQKDAAAKALHYKCPVCLV
jgi:hypothetical protein